MPCLHSGGRVWSVQQPILLADQYKTGVLKTGAGLDIAMSQNVPSHTVGPLGGSPLVNGANQGLINAGTTDNPFAATTTLVTDGWDGCRGSAPEPRRHVHDRWRVLCEPETINRPACCSRSW